MTKYYSIVPNIDNRSPNKVARELGMGFERYCNYDIRFVYVKKIISEWPEQFSNYRRIKLYSLIEMMKSDVIVHSHGFFPDMLNFVLGLLGSKSVRITTLHSIISKDLSEKRFGVFFSKVWMLMLKNFDSIFVLSESARDEYLKILGVDFSDRIKVVANPLIIEEEIYNDNNKSIIETINNQKKLGNYILGSCSVLREMKGIQYAISMLKDTQNINLVILGDGPYSETLKSLVKEYNLDDKIFFTGFVNHPHSIMKEFDCFLLTSDYEGFPLSLMEAVNLKVPVICNDIEIFREFFNDKEVNFVDVKSDFYFKNKVEELIYERKAKVEFAYKRLIENYTIEKVLEVYNSSIKKILL